MAVAPQKGWKHSLVFGDAAMQEEMEGGCSSFSPAARIIFLQKNRQDTKVTCCQKKH